MPFQARCLFCGQQVRVPDHALGASGCCPKCSNFFTLAPASAVKSPPPGMGQSTQPAPASGSSLLAMAKVLDSHEGMRSKRRWIHPFGLCALVSDGGALL